MKQFIVITLLASAALSVNGQNSIDAVLRSIEANNKELQANNQLTVSKKLEAKLDNNLPDPSVSYVHQYGNPGRDGDTGRVGCIHSRSTSLRYMCRRINWRNRKPPVSTARGQSFVSKYFCRQKKICLDLVLLNQQRALLDQRRQNAEQLAELYAMRLETGDANILETNKIDLELLNAKTEARMNESARIAKLQELATLNGGIAIDFTDTTYMSDGDILSFEELCAEAVTSNPQLLTLKSEQVAARRQLSVNKSKSLPSFELGYRMNTATGGERFNGFLVGISIPLFSNRNNVKQAKAQALYTDLQLESTTTTVESELHQLYNQSVALKTSMDEYNTVLKSQNSLALLNKAIQTGQISMIEYFVDVTTFYQSMQNYMQLQNEYQKVMAQLYKYKL